MSVLTLAKWTAVIPIGFVVALGARGRLLRRTATATAVALSLSLAVEAGQSFLEPRHATPYDVLLNTAGASVAAISATLLGLRLGAEHLIKYLSRAVFIAVLAYMLLAAAAVEREGVLESWDPEHLIVSGDEVSRDRTYVGAVINAVVCAGFPPDRVCAFPGASLELRRRIVEKALQAQQISLSARVFSRSAEQEGPTRMVTFSAGTDSRNVTLGQEGNSLVLRVRTPLSGPNGTDVFFRLRGAVPTGVWSNVTASFGSNGVIMSVVSAQNEARGEFRRGLLENWLFFRPESLPFDGGSAREVRSAGPGGLLSAVVLFLPLGLLLGGEARRIQGGLLMVGAAAAGVILYLTDALIGGPPALAHVVMAMVATLAGIVLGRVDRLHSPAGVLPKEVGRWDW